MGSGYGAASIDRVDRYLTAVGYPQPRPDRMRRPGQCARPAAAQLGFAPEWLFSGVPPEGIRSVFRLVKKNDIFAKKVVDSFGGVAL